MESAETTISELGKLKQVHLRKKWTNESQEFTPWLAENIELLNNALGLELDVENIEVAAGPYSADIVARDAGTGKYVIIENQLGKTDHDHLGKSITYASVLDASSVIWIASEFTDEHKKALDWLNDHTSDELSFYGVNIELWQIDDSKPAVRFNVKSTPNTAVRQAAKSKASEDLSEPRKLQLDFWTKFRDALIATKKVPSTQSPRPQYWFDVSLGKSYIHISNICNTYDNTIGVRVYIGNKIADEMLPYLEEQKEDIENEIGDKLEWNPNPDNRDKVIALYTNVDLTNEEARNSAIEWLVKRTLAFRKAFSPRVKRFQSST